MLNNNNIKSEESNHSCSCCHDADPVQTLPDPENPDKFEMVHDSRHRSDEEKKALLNRLKRVEGQVRGLEKMVEDNAYCPDVLIQVSAVTSALNSFNKELMASHIKHCVVEDVRNGDEAIIDELVKVMQKLMK